eukprot:360750-Chlamydomonas_euryale.AAC.7
MREHARLIAHSTSAQVPLRQKTAGTGSFLSHALPLVHQYKCNAAALLRPQDTSSLLVFWCACSGQLSVWHSNPASIDHAPPCQHPASIDHAPPCQHPASIDSAPPCKQSCQH